MRWFREHSKLVAILAIALVLMITMIISFVLDGKSSQLAKLTGGGLTEVQKPIVSFGNSVADGLSSIFSFNATKKENEELKTKVAELNRKIVSLQLDRAELEELEELKSVLNYQGIAVGYNYVAADVTAIDESDLFNIFTINVGTDEGVALNSVIIDGDGLIGRVFSIGTNWAKVISVIDENNSVSFRVFRDVSLLGVLSGDGKGGLNGYMLNSEAAVIEGDELITSGMGSYPAGIVIGKVTEVVWQNDQLIKAVSIEPSVDFNDIRKVMAVTPI